MFSTQSRVGPQAAAALLLGAAMLSGCTSKQEKALEQAKKQAAATGNAQRVVSVDKDGTTTTTIVQPPASGQKEEAVTTTTTPPAQGAKPPAAGGPLVSAVPPPAPPAPVKVSIPSGTVLSIRIDRRISVKTSHAGDRFTGEVVDPVLDNYGGAVLPKGTRVDGVVVESHRGGHFKGRSTLELRLTSLQLNGTRYPLKTSDLARTRKGKGRRTVGLVGGGAGLGMLVGGVARGGPGLIVGGLVGGGAGAAGAGLTGNRNLEIPAETVVHFKLAGALVVQSP